MASLSKCHSPSPSSIKPSSQALNLTSRSRFLISNYFPRRFSETQSSNQAATTITTSAKFFPVELRSVDARRFLLGFGLCYPFPCFAADEPSSKINLESVLVSIDNFFNRYPFFVATVTFIWLVVIPLTEEYLQKYKFVSAINAFKKLQNDPNCQLLDVRDGKSAAYLSPPNLKIFNKSVARVEYREGEDEEAAGFFKSVLENFKDPANTSVCIIDSFDGNSMKVAELLVKNGFKEAYAIRGGILGKNGWQEIQEELLPPSVHVVPKKRMTGKASEQLKTNGSVSLDEPTSSSPASRIDKDMIESKGGDRPLSPYPNYPGFKPPSSPTPSKPK